MKDQKQNKQNGKIENIHPIVTTVAGAVIGAGIAAAGIILSEEKNRTKIKEVAQKVKKNVVESAKDLKNRAKMEKQELAKRLLVDKEKVRKVVKSAIKSLDKTTLEVNSALKAI